MMNEVEELIEKEYDEQFSNFLTVLCIHAGRTRLQPFLAYDRRVLLDRLFVRQLYLEEETSSLKSLACLWDIAQIFVGVPRDTQLLQARYTTVFEHLCKILELEKPSKSDKMKIMAVDTALQSAVDLENEETEDFWRMAYGSWNRHRPSEAVPLVQAILNL